jgi:hypothetical protein
MCPVVVNFSIFRADLDKKTQNMMEQDKRAAGSHLSLFHPQAAGRIDLLLPSLCVARTSGQI